MRRGELTGLSGVGLRGLIGGLIFVVAGVTTEALKGIGMRLQLCDVSQECKIRVRLREARFRVKIGEGSETRRKMWG